MTLEKAKTVGIHACIEKLGREFVSEHKDNAVASWGKLEGGMHCFVGVDPTPCRPFDGTLTLDGENSGWPYYASCIVSLENGNVTFLECVLPVSA